MSWTTDKKLAFVHKMTKEALSSIPHYDAGGTVLGGPNTTANSTGGNGPQGLLPNINAGLGLNNPYQGQAANVQAGTNANQLNNAYTGVQSGLNNQNGLVTQTQPGINQGLSAQSTLSNQFSAEAAGQGPNPAQAALNQSTGQNIAQQAALAAGQRGAGANAGLIASQNAQQGAATQQQAVGQAATLQAQQQIAAQQAQQQLAATQVGQGATAIQNQNQTQQNEQGILQGANTSLNNANVAQQSNINNVNSQTAAANQNAASNLFGGLTSGFGSVSSVSSMFADGGEVGDDTPEFQSTPSDASSGPSVPSSGSLPANQTNFSSSGGGSSGGGGGGAGIAALAALANGGKVQNMAGGGYLSPTPLVVNNPYSASGPQSAVGQYLNSSGASSGPQVSATSALPENTTDFSDILSPTPATPDAGPGTGGSSAGSGASPKVGGIANTMMEAKGGKVMKMLPPMKGKNAALIANGGKVKADGKGQEAKVNHDSYANDKVPALLSQGEVVLDKDTLNDPGQIGQMARAVAHHIAQRNSSKGGRRV